MIITRGNTRALLTSTPGPGDAFSFSTKPGGRLVCKSTTVRDSASAAPCRTEVIQYAVPSVLQLLHSFLILIVKHHGSRMLRSKIQSKIFDLFGFSHI